VLSEAVQRDKARAHDLIADLAPTLKEGELRVLIALSSLFATTEHRSGRISASNLAKAAKLTEPNVRKAIDSLEQRSLIAKRKGTATEPSGYGLIFLNITKMPERGGSFKDPPPQGSQKTQGLFETHPAQKAPPEVGLLQTHHL